MIAYQLESINWTELLARFSSGRLPGIFAMLVVILIGAQLADFTWVLVDRWVPEATQQQPQVKAPQTGKRSDSRQSVNAIVNQHLFGKVDAKPVARKVPVNAPATNLQLTLNGVFASGKSEGYAIISEGKRDNQKLYHIGDKVSGATLQEVLPDHVILMRNGQYETLRFPEIKESGLNIQSTAAPQVRRTAAMGSRRTEMLNLVQIIPVNKRGKITGYRILPKKDRGLYNKLGLKPSDLVVAINGISLLDQNNFSKVMGLLASANQMDVEVMRQGRKQSLHIELP